MNFNRNHSIEFIRVLGKILKSVVQECSDFNQGSTAKKIYHTSDRQKKKKNGWGNGREEGGM